MTIFFLFIILPINFEADLSARKSGFLDLSIGVGELPTDVLQVSIMVNEFKYADALKIIANYEKILSEPVQDGKSWICEECDQLNPETFEICWSCQANRLTVA